MSVLELMVSICIIAIAASVAVPAYINSLQQGRVVALILPRLQTLEFRVELFYNLKGRLPLSTDVEDVLEEVDTENLEIGLSSGVITMKVVAKAPVSKLHMLDGKILIASPVITKNGVVFWHLGGELANRLQINY